MSIYCGRNSFTDYQELLGNETGMRSGMNVAFHTDLMTERSPTSSTRWLFIPFSALGVSDVRITMSRHYTGTENISI